MKRLALLALVGSAISFALPTFAQQKDTITDPQIVDQLKAIGKKTGEAFAKNDATALAALYTEDAVLVPDTGPVYGREAIEKFWAGLFKKFHVINEVDTSDPYSPHRMGTAGDEAWSTGQWTLTFQGPNGSPVELTGHWTEIYRREGDRTAVRILVYVGSDINQNPYRRPKRARPALWGCLWSNLKALPGNSNPYRPPLPFGIRASVFTWKAVSKLLNRAFWNQSFRGGTALSSRKLHS